MICEPGLEPQFELYQLHPDGSKEFTIVAAPGWYGENTVIKDA